MYISKNLVKTAKNIAFVFVENSQNRLNCRKKCYSSLRAIRKTHLRCFFAIEYLEAAFIISKANRYNVKGRKYIGTPLKYYFEDVGLRNARLGFRQIEETHLMENISLLQVRDSFKKIIVVKDVVNVTRDEHGITTMSVYDFLLKVNSLEL